MPDDFTHQLKGILWCLRNDWVNQSKTISLPLTHRLPGVPHWRVKSSGVRQSKILSLAGLGRFGRQRVNPFWLLRMRFYNNRFYSNSRRFYLSTGSILGHLRSQWVEQGRSFRQMNFALGKREKVYWPEEQVKFASVSSVMSLVESTLYKVDFWLRSVRNMIFFNLREKMSWSINWF